MRKIGVRRISWIVIVLSLLIPTMLVSAKELGKITITGPKISGTLIIDDPDELNRLSGEAIMDYTTQVSAPASPGEGYVMTIYMRMEEDLRPALQLTYYPNQVDGQGFFNSVILMPESGTVDRAGKWYQVPRRTESSLKKMLVSHGVTIPVARQSQPTTATSAMIWSAGILATLLCTALLVRRLTLSRQARTAAMRKEES